MPDHYYTQTPASAHRPGQVDFLWRGTKLVFETDSGVFSRTEIDKGTEILLNALPEELSGSLLDLGCGYGVIGVTLGRRYPGLSVTMSDVNERAVELSRRNAQHSGIQAQVMQSDGYASIPFRHYDWILQNPPIRAGKSVIYAMFAEGARRLEPNGALWLVIRKQQGAESAAAYLKTLFGQVEAVTKKGGYWVLRCAQPVENV